MDKGLHVFQSNRLESLLEPLYETLFRTSADPFCQRLIIVPHTAMKNWLQQQLASSPRIGIAMGMEIQTEDIALSRLVARLCPLQQGVVPSRLEVSLALEVLIHSLVANFAHMTEGDRRIWKPLIGLMQGLQSSTQQRRRITSLSEELAGLFESYGKHAIRVVDTWASKKDIGWQEHLWLLLHRTYPDWYSWAHYINAAITTASPSLPTIALFGINYLSPLHHRFLEKISEQIPVYFFMLSACQYYWSDIQSDRDATRLRRHMQKSGVTSAQQQAMEELLQDTNPLLANLGKLGRTMAWQLENSNAGVEGAFYISQPATDIPAYADCLTEDTLIVEGDAPLSLLEALQADMLLLRNPSQASPLHMRSDDQSVQLHAAPSRLREVEAIYNTLLGIIDRHQGDSKPIAPADILIMAPDISLYQSSIEAVFGSQSSQLPYQIGDLSMSSQNAFAQAFFELVGLSKSRWDASSIVQLLYNPYFAKKHNFTAEELERIRAWIDKTSITWGKDLQHRNQILRQAHCHHGMSSDGYVGTWNHGIGRLLRCLVTGDNKETSAKLTFSDAELLSRWLAVMDSLWADLRLLIDDVAMTIADWATYLECLCDGYLATTDRRSEADRLGVYQLISKLRKASRFFPHETFSYTAIAGRLEVLFNATSASRQEGALQAIRFGSMQSLSGQPAAVVVLLGLDEGAYPRLQRRKALDILLHHPDADPAPTPMDIDRYLFLEAMVSARQHLIMSYCAVCPDDGKEQSASVVVCEMLTYLDRYYRLEERSAAHAIVINEPFYPFDASYFVGSRPLEGHSQKDYKAAMALQHTSKEISQGFLPELFTLSASRSSQEPSSHSIIDISDLSRAAKNPLKLYLNSALQLYLKDIDRTALAVEEPFALSALDKYQVAQDILNTPIDKVLEQQLQQGHLPLGLFGEVARRELHQLTEQQSEAWKAFETSPDQIFQLEFAVNCSTPTQLSDLLWRLPAPTIQLADGSSVQVVGRLSDLTPKGVLSSGKNEAKYMVRSWPHLILLHHLKPMVEDVCRLHITSKVLFMKSGKTSEALQGDMQEQLINFITYARECLKQPSPLIDDWVADFVADTPDRILKTIASDLESSDFHNSEAIWLFKGYEKRLQPESLKHWQDKARELYGEALENLKVGRK